MDPVPKSRSSGDNFEIASKNWCPDCNALTMGLIFRGSTAYTIPKSKEVKG